MSTSNRHIEVPMTERQIDLAQVRLPLLAGAVWLLALIVFFWETVGSMVNIWLTSETYTHGLLVIPISAWLIWRMRYRFFDALSHGPTALALAFLPALILIWLAGQLVSVQLVTQFAVVAILVTGLVSMFGTAAARVALFPLAFLFLMVPVGSGLEPPMMDLTAKYTVALIQLTGIPVYQEGRFFQLPSGSWSVVEACSGVRYLIASFTLGLIYAHLSYQSIGKKLAFVVASIAVPVVANVFRAYLIVMLGHLSGMELATGVDHLIYGWIFFGVVMLLLFYIGGFWADDAPGPATVSVSATPAMISSPLIWGCTIAAMLFAASAPALYGYFSAERNQLRFAPLELIETPSHRCTTPSSIEWKPRSVGSDRQLSLACLGEPDVHVFANQFLSQANGQEVAQRNKGLKGEEGNRWRPMEESSGSVSLANGGELSFDEVILRSNRTGKNLLVWYWYLVNEDSASNPVQVKILELKHLLSRDHKQSSLVYAAVRLDLDEASAARDSLREFLRENGALLSQRLALTESLP